MPKIGAFGAIAFAAMQILSGILPGSPPASGAADGEFLAYYADSRTLVASAAVIGALAALPFFAVTASLTALPSATRSDLAILVVSVAAATGLSLAGTAASITATFLVDHGLDGQTARLLFALQAAAYLLIAVPATGLIIAGTRAARGASDRGIRLAAGIAVAAMLASLGAAFVDNENLGLGGSLLVVRDVPFVAWLLFLAAALHGHSSRRVAER